MEREADDETMWRTYENYPHLHYRCCHANIAAGDGRSISIAINVDNVVDSHHQHYLFGPRTSTRPSETTALATESTDNTSALRLAPSTSSTDHHVAVNDGDDFHCYHRRNDDLGQV